MTTRLKFGMKSLAIGLCFLLTFPVLQAQQPQEPQTPIPTELNLVVVEGEGAINNVRQRVTRDPIVRVEDENHKPVVGAAVTFTLPTEGATGEFGNGAKSLTVMTDNQGQATATGLRMNPVDGKVPIHVNAAYRGVSTRTTITQFSVLPPGVKPVTSSTAASHGHGALIGILVALGAAAAGGGAYLATHNSNNSTTPTTPTTPTGPAAIGITAGTGSIAGGH